MKKNDLLFFGKKWNILFIIMIAIMIIAIFVPGSKLLSLVAFIIGIAQIGFTLLQELLWKLFQKGKFNTYDPKRTEIACSVAKALICLSLCVIPSLLFCFLELPRLILFSSKIIGIIMKAILFYVSLFSFFVYIVLTVVMTIIEIKIIRKKTVDTVQA